MRMRLIGGERMGVAGGGWVEVQWLCDANSIGLSE